MGQTKDTTRLLRQETGVWSRRVLTWFVLIDDMLYPTIEHPEGQSHRPWFRIVGDEIFPHTGHPCGPGFLPWYRRENDRLLPLEAHPDRENEARYPFTVSGPWPTASGVDTASEDESARAPR